MDYIVVARMRVSADTPEQAKDRVETTIRAGQLEDSSCPNLGYTVDLIAIEPPRAEPDLADTARRTLMAGFTS